MSCFAESQQEPGLQRYPEEPETVQIRKDSIENAVFPDKIIGMS